MIDLQPFCGKDPFRVYLHKPFSHGDWSYASNGHILVRVPRRDDVPENVQGGFVDKTVASAGPIPTLRPLPPIALPPPETRTCADCEGRGFEHDCPDCECACETCGGDGKELEKLSVSFGGVPFSATYIRLLLVLPNSRIAEAPSNDKPTWFAFDGGDGLLMPLRTPHANNIDADAPELWP